jgi:catechol 2,3-dioxygenase-like lactoylglutathione lyase family enzyme
MAVLGLNHIAFRSTDAAALRDFYLTLLAAEELGGEHGVLRAGSLVLAFVETDAPQGRPDDGDALAFEVDAAGFEEVLGRAGDLGRWSVRPWPTRAGHAGLRCATRRGGAWSSCMTTSASTGARTSSLRAGFGGRSGGAG